MSSNFPTDLRVFQTHLLKNKYNAKASAPSRRAESRARFDRDMWRGRTRQPQAKSEVVQKLSDHDGQLYEKLTSGQIRLARVDSPKIRRRAVAELRRAGLTKKIARFFLENQTYLKK